MNSVRNRVSLLLARRRSRTAVGLLLCLLISLAAVVSICGLRSGGQPQEAAVWPAPTETPEEEWTKLDLPPESELPASLAASKVDAAGVDTGSDFVLKASIDIEESTLREGLRVEPAVALAIEKTGEREFHLVPEQPLKEETLYRFQLTLPQAGEGALSRSWAFQTRTPLRVVQTLPRHAAGGVPLNTGIELTFSHEGVENLDPFFEMTPPTAGRFEIHKRVAVFVPESLQPNTVYTVTVRKGLAVSGSGLTLADDFSFQFETGKAGRTGETPLPSPIGFWRKVNESSSTEAPALSLTSGATELSFAVYRYPGLEPFAAALRQFKEIPSWARNARTAYVADTTGLPLAMTFDAKPQSLSTRGQEFFVLFPAPLPSGFYLVEATSDGKKGQAWLQVTDIATHVSVSRTKTLVWVNDAAAQAPLAGAMLTLSDGSYLATTDEQGVAFFDTPPSLLQTSAQEYGYKEVAIVQDLVVTDSGGRQALVPLKPSSSSEMSGGFSAYGYDRGSDLYWNYVYIDRPLYLPKDTVHFWGIVKKREDAPAQQEVTVELSGHEYYGLNNRELRLASATLTTSPLGTFSGELSFEGAAPGHYSLAVKVGDAWITSQYLEVRAYTKPAYKIEVVPSRKTIFAGETVEFAIDVSFFEGSPVPNAVLAYSIPGGSPVANTAPGGSTAPAGEVTTDARGHAVVSYTAALAPSYYTNYDYRTLEVRPKAAEEGEITGSAGVRVLPSALTIEAKGSYKDGTARVEGVVRNVDLSRVDAEKPTYYYSYSNQDWGPPAPGREVTLDISEVSYERIEAGQSYDFIKKIVVPQYTYRSTETPLGQFTVVTDGNGAFSYSFPASESKSYHVVVTSLDDQGRAANAQFAVSSYVGNVYAEPNANPYLQLGDSGWCGANGGYEVGEQVELVMRYGKDAAPSGGANRYLFLQAQNGIRDYEVQDSPSLSFPFPERYVPNVTVFGVRFTGGTYKAALWGCAVSADPESRRLDIKVTPDRERYEPGDEATLRVSARDSEGNPVRAEVNLSAVDEAIFRLQGPYSSSPNRRDILADLYESVGHGLITSYSSHQYPGGEMPGGRGGGDGGPRTDFQDIALFQSVTTDDQGQARVTFKLPDNLTSWRIVAQGVTEDLKAGGTLRLLPVGLPFFVDVAMNSEYLTSDEAQIRLRAFGQALAEGDKVTFEVTCPTLGIDDPIRASGAAFEPVDVPLPELVEGEHELLIKATAGDLSDSMTRRFRVVESRLLRAEAQFYDLTPGLTIAGSSDGRTRVVFSDHNRGRYYPLLLQLSWTYGDRVDQMLARNLSQELLKRYFDEENANPAEFEPASYQTPQGGIALFPYADADLALSARLAALAPDRFGRNALASYFTKIAEDRNETRERVITALYGLAALGEPVLQELSAVAGEPDLTWRERLYLGLAALAAGDEDTARRVYRSLLTDFGERRLPYLRLRVGVDQDDILEATSLAAILGGGLGDEMAPRLFEYTRISYTTDILIQLEQISYLASALPRLPAEPVRFAYQRDGKRREAKLERGGSLAMSLTAKQLQELQPEPLAGNVGVASFYLAPFEPEEAVTDPDVSISRRFELADEPGNVYNDDSVVRIVIDWKLGAQALDGCYQVTDILPSGLKPITRLAAWGNAGGGAIGRYGVSPYQVEGQRVSFCVGKSPWQRPIVYYARVIGKGKYTGEPAIIQSMRSAESFNLTPADSVQIR